MQQVQRFGIGEGLLRLKYAVAQLVLDAVLGAHQFGIRHGAELEGIGCLRIAHSRIVGMGQLVGDVRAVVGLLHAAWGDVALRLGAHQRSLL